MKGLEDGEFSLNGPPTNVNFIKNDRGDFDKEWPAKRNFTAGSITKSDLGRPIRLPSGTEGKLLGFKHVLDWNVQVYVGPDMYFRSETLDPYSGKDQVVFLD